MDNGRTGSGASIDYDYDDDARNMLMTDSRGERYRQQQHNEFPERIMAPLMPHASSQVEVESTHGGSGGGGAHYLFPGEVPGQPSTTSTRASSRDNSAAAARSTNRDDHAASSSPGGGFSSKSGSLRTWLRNSFNRTSGGSPSNFNLRNAPRGGAPPLGRNSATTAAAVGGITTAGVNVPTRGGGSSSSTSVVSGGSSTSTSLPVRAGPDADTTSNSDGGSSSSGDSVAALLSLIRAARERAAASQVEADVSAASTAAHHLAEAELQLGDHSLAASLAHAAVTSPTTARVLDSVTATLEAAVTSSSSVSAAREDGDFNHAVRTLLRTVTDASRERGAAAVEVSTGLANTAAERDAAVTRGDQLLAAMAALEARAAALERRVAEVVRAAALPTSTSGCAAATPASTSVGGARAVVVPPLALPTSTSSYDVITRGAASVSSEEDSGADTDLSHPRPTSTYDASDVPSSTNDAAAAAAAASAAPTDQVELEAVRGALTRSQVELEEVRDALTSLRGRTVVEVARLKAEHAETVAALNFNIEQRDAAASALSSLARAELDARADKLTGLSAQLTAAAATAARLSAELEAERHSSQRQLAAAAAELEAEQRSSQLQLAAAAAELEAEKQKPPALTGHADADGLLQSFSASLAVREADFRAGCERSRHDMEAARLAAVASAEAAHAELQLQRTQLQLEVDAARAHLQHEVEAARALVQHEVDAAHARANALDERSSQLQLSERRAAEHQLQLDAAVRVQAVFRRFATRAMLERLARAETTAADADALTRQLECERAEVVSERSELAARGARLAAREIQLAEREESSALLGAEVTARETSLFARSVAVEAAASAAAASVATFDARAAELDARATQLNAYSDELAAARAELEAREAETASSALAVDVRFAAREAATLDGERLLQIEVAKAAERSSALSALENHLAAVEARLLAASSALSARETAVFAREQAVSALEDVSTVWERIRAAQVRVVTKLKYAMGVWERIQAEVRVSENVCIIALCTYDVVFQFQVGVSLMLFIFWLRPRILTFRSRLRPTFIYLFPSPLAPFLIQFFTHLIHSFTRFYTLVSPF